MGCEEEARRIFEFVAWRVNNLPEYRGWLRDMLKAWGLMLNEANNQRSLLPFAAAALTHLAVGLATTKVLEGMEPEEALREAEEQLCAVHRAAVMLFRDALERGALLEVIKEAQKEAAREIERSGEG